VSYKPEVSLMSGLPTTREIVIELLDFLLVLFVIPLAGGCFEAAAPGPRSNLTTLGD